MTDESLAERILRDLTQDPARARAHLRDFLAAGPRPADVARIHRLLGGWSNADAAAASLRTPQVYCVRTVTLEPIAPYLTVASAARGFLPRFQYGAYGAFFDDLSDPSGPVAAARPDVVLVALDLEDVAGDLPDVCARCAERETRAAVDAATERLCGLVQSLRAFSRARVIVQGLVTPSGADLGGVSDANVALGLRSAVSEINAGLARVCRDIGDAVFVDLERVAAAAGTRTWRDARLFLSSRVPVAPDRFGEYAAVIARHLKSLFVPPRKVLVTDLDNTLWGGIVGEDGPDAIVTGPTFPGNMYRPFQNYLRSLSSRGVLLAIASKNDEHTVVTAFERRRNDLAVHLDDFVAVRIGWESKVESLCAIAAELSLGLDSLVFVDDSPVECEEVRAGLPQVEVIEVPRDEPWMLPDLIEASECFDHVVVTPDDRRRASLYRARREATDLEARAGSREEFLHSLDICCTISDALEAPLSRTVQLVGKTNQFNLTTRRHSEAEIRRIANSPCGQAWAIRVEDRFGDSGVVGVALAVMESGTCVIETFLLSCRVIGRGIETALLAHVVERARLAGASTVVGEYIPTERNGLCADLYPRHGFQRTDGSTDAQRFVLDLTVGTVQTPGWIRLVTSQ